MFFEEKNNEKPSLFTKFNNEADKIRAWKTQTEFSLQLKDKKILEMSNLITNMKARLSETLNDKKYLDVRLQQEEENKQDIISKNSSNREMCYELKNYIYRMNAQLEQTEAEKDELKTNLKSNINIIEDLFSKYKLCLVDLEEKKESSAFITMQKQSENYDLIQQLNSTSLDFQKQIDHKNEEIFELKSRLDNLHCDVDDLSSKLHNNKEMRVQLLNELSKKNDSLEQTLDSLAICENKCVDFKKQISDFIFSKSLLQQYVTSLNKEISAVHQRKDELQGQVQGLEIELKTATLALNGSADEIDSIRHQLHNILGEKILIEDEKKELVKKLDELENTVERCELTINHSRMEFKNLQDEFSERNIYISSLKQNILIVENDNKELQELSKIKSEEITALLQIINQKEKSFYDKMYECDAMEQKFLEIIEEKTKISELLESTRNEFESKLQFERIEFEENIKEKLDKISFLESEQKSLNQKIENLKCECQKHLKDMEDISQDAKMLSDEKIKAGMLLNDVTSQLHLERDDFHKQLDSHKRHISLLQQELSKTKLNLAFSFNKCKTEYDNLLKLRNDEMHKLELDYSLQIENLKKEVVHFKNMTISSNCVDSKIIRFAYSESQEFLSRMQAKDDGSESVSCSDLTSWIDSDPVFGS